MNVDLPSVVDHTFHVRHLPAAIALMIISCATSVHAQTGLLTFAFEAEVTDIIASADVEFSLPSEIVNGGKFDALVTFDPPMVFGRDTENAALLASIGSTIFFDEGLPFITDNDTGGTTGNSTVLVDSILVECGGLVPCSDTTTDAPGIRVLNFGLVLEGDYTAINPLLDTGNDADAWNRLTRLRRLFFEISSPTATGSYLVLTQAGPVRAIPEPTSLLQVALLGAFLPLIRAQSR